MNLLLSGIWLATGCVMGAATNDLSLALQRGLFEEEANHDLTAAIKAYQAVAIQFDKDRRLAATAIFRLGECYRKKGDTNGASGQYQRILREFSDQEPLLDLSRQSLAALGALHSAPGNAVQPGAALEEQRRLSERELKLLEMQLAQFRQLPGEKLRVAIQQQFPNPVLTSTMQRLGLAEQELAQKKAEFGDKHVEVRKAAATLEALNRQVDDQIEGVLTSLETKRQAAEASLAAANILAKPASGDSGTASSDEVQRIRALIKDSPDLINAPDKNGETQLESAAAKGKLAIVNLLLENGAAINGIREPGLTPLHYAAANGHKAVVDALLGRRAKVDAATGGGVTPLHLTAQKGYEAVAKALLTAGASVNARTSSGGKWDSEDLRCQVLSGQTPLHIAADAGYTGLIDLLLSKGAQVDAEDNAGRTPLSYAAQKGSSAVIKLLLAAHANPNAGRTMLPLAQAAHLGDVPMLNLLLSHGADPNALSKVDWPMRPGSSYYPPGSVSVSPLFLAVSTRHPEAVSELLRAKANADSLDPQQKPIVFEALGSAATLGALLEGGANPNLPGRDGLPPLYRAVSDKNFVAAELLLAHHADVNSKVNNDTTPLHAAAQMGAKEIAELLLKNAADVNATRKNGDTPLHLAVEGRWQEMIELLLANQADPNARNKAGATPLDLAKSYESPGGYLPGGMPGPVPGAPSYALPGVTSIPGPASASTPPLSLADLLRQHGAVEDLPHLDRIEVTRRAANYSETVFVKGANDYNRFTILEVIAAHYGLVSTDPGPEGTRQRFDYTSLQSHGPYATKGLFFPDLAKVRLYRAKPDGRGRESLDWDLERILKSGDCSRNFTLQWGDAVEIPEADHPINATWQGLPQASLLMLSNCLRRTVEITVKGQTTNILLKLFNLEERDYGQALLLRGGFAIPQFSLLPVLNNSGLLRASSDLSRVKVSRLDTATGQRYGLLIDCSSPSGPPDLWLRDGDKIDVPERSAGPSSTANPPNRTETPFEQRLREIRERAGAGAAASPSPARVLRLPSMATNAPTASPGSEN